MQSLAARRSGRAFESRNHQVKGSWDPTVRMAQIVRSMTGWSRSWA